jgi:hypothetical protein
MTSHTTSSHRRSSIDSNLCLQPRQPQHRASDQNSNDVTTFCLNADAKWGIMNQNDACYRASHSNDDHEIQELNHLLQEAMMEK